ncbi:MAG: ATP-binding protein [Flammeovirgaceae bacterium]|nr:ATP-binding protein [Flammeovirgaceae bacterium]
MFHAKISEIDAIVTSNFDQAPTVNYVNIYLESIFLNLLSNALKYRQHNLTPKIHFKTQSINGNVVLKVSDNGLGINLKKYGHLIFKMRKTFHRHPDSRGIGLFMVKNQVDSMGGEITLESKENVGTTITINFNKKTDG